MPNIEDLKALRQEIEENYRKDLAAVDWLILRNVALNAELSPKATGLYPKADVSPKAQDIDPELEGAYKMAEDIIGSDPAKQWTVGELMARMVEQGFDAAGKRPDAKVNVIVNSMAESGLVRIVRHAAGRRPKLFVFAGQAKIHFLRDHPVNEKEADSEEAAS